QVAGHQMSKRYLAVVRGSLPKDDWLELDGPIARDRHDARKMRVGRTGKPSLTRVRTLAHSGGRSLVLVELLSGRRHQIRVHLAHAGHPIVGDALYGGRPEKPCSARNAARRAVRVSAPDPSPCTSRPRGLSTAQSTRSR
ncbi:MAG: RNA pseudouridine synthase, partial [Atopobiaceae bacterium]|nr:RNA pseudouridine synthase [Atopobiaceae bacterium]